MDSAVVTTAARGDTSCGGYLARAVGLRFYGLADLIDQGFVSLEYVPTKENKADLFTKVFGAFELDRLRPLVGLVNETA